MSGTIAVLGLTSLHAFWVYKYYSKSARLYAQLIYLSYMPAAYFNDQRIQKYMAISFAMIHLVFSALVCVLLWTADAIMEMGNK